jgi:hypothetical protein
MIRGISARAARNVTTGGTQRREAGTAANGNQGRGVEKCETLSLKTGSGSNFSVRDLNGGGGHAGMAG